MCPSYSDSADPPDFLTHSLIGLVARFTVELTYANFQKADVTKTDPIENAGTGTI
jgi:hypothetical protein